MRKIRCPECGSTNLRFMSAELSFAQTTDDFVYSLQSASVCLDCGSATSCVLPDTLEKLKKQPRVHGAVYGTAITRMDCIVCRSRDIEVFDEVEIAFGTRLSSPVHLKQGATVRVCLGCGLSEFQIPEQDLQQIRSRIGAHGRPPGLASISKRARGAA